ncbi:MAG: uracil phosphoribosyltransferase [Chlamydiales bacterium]|jgi:uracil phosphoribosyltransferase
MNLDKAPYLSVLRNKNTSLKEYREATKQITLLLAQEVGKLLETESYEIETPMGPCPATRYKSNPIIVPILRAGLSMLSSFEIFFPQSPVGFVGIERNEETALPNLYYCNLPYIRDGQEVVIIDPMLATGGSLKHTIELLKERDCKEEQILFAGIICSTEGRKNIESEFSKVRMAIATEDSQLNSQKYIVPGLGDFGDRYYGTE